MLIAAVGFDAAVGLELAPAFAAGDDRGERLTFGKLEPLVALMQETDPSRLMGEVARKLRTGTSLRDVVAAAALANARTFGGEDYIGFHTMMALAPSYQMALILPENKRPLPVMKVLYRNSNRIQEHGGPESEVLHPVVPAAPGADSGADAVALREAVRKKDVAQAERIFARLAAGPLDQAFDGLLLSVEDASEVHRVVMPYRARHLIDLIGNEHAHTLLRQSVRYCVTNHATRLSDAYRAGDLLPKLLDRYRLPAAPTTERAADDRWVASLCETFFRSKPADAAEAAAAALSQGYPWQAVGEAISLTANALVLRDVGRTASEAKPPAKPIGSVHGDSIGVHASDSANAWRNMARYSGPRNRAACLILGAHQVALDRTVRHADIATRKPYPTDEHLARLRGNSPDELLAEAEGAVRANDQGRAAAAVHQFGERGGDPRQAFAVLLKYAISEDGALHAEKYFETTYEDFHATRPSLRWRHLVGLARVTASAYGRPAPGIREAQELLAAEPA